MAIGAIRFAVFYKLKPGGVLLSIHPAAAPLEVVVSEDNLGKFSRGGRTATIEIPPVYPSAVLGESMPDASPTVVEATFDGGERVAIPVMYEQAIVLRAMGDSTNSSLVD